MASNAGTGAGGAPARTIPIYFPATIARQFLYLREAQTLGQNMGQRVNGVQMWGGGEEAIGTSWCAWFAVGLVLDICYQGNAPIPRMGSCEDIRQFARQKGMIIESPVVNCLVLFVGADGVAHHIGIVTSVDPLIHISGNTSALGAEDSFNGDRVAEKPAKARAGGSLVFVDVSKGPLPR